MVCREAEVAWVEGRKHVQQLCWRQLKSHNVLAAQISFAQEGRLRLCSWGGWSPHEEDTRQTDAGSLRMCFSGSMRLAAARLLGETAWLP